MRLLSERPASTVIKKNENGVISNGDKSYRGTEDLGFFTVIRYNDES